MPFAANCKSVVKADGVFKSPTSIVPAVVLPINTPGALTQSETLRQDISNPPKDFVLRF